MVFLHQHIFCLIVEILTGITYNTCVVICNCVCVFRYSNKLVPIALGLNPDARHDVQMMSCYLLALATAQLEEDVDMLEGRHQQQQQQQQTKVRTVLAGTSLPATSATCCGAQAASTSTTTPATLLPQAPAPGSSALTGLSPVMWQARLGCVLKHSEELFGFLQASVVFESGVLDVRAW